MKAALFGCGTRDTLTSWGLLVLRVLTGLMLAVGHGWPKVMAFEKLKDDWFVPAFLPFLSPPVSLLLTIGAELVAASLLVIGLMTRPAAAILAFTMAVAAFAVLGKAPSFRGPGVSSAEEPALLCLIPALVLLVTGAGTKSVDSLISKPKRRSKYA